MFGWLFGRHLKDVVLSQRRVRVKGIWFKIRKINPLDYLDGSKAAIQTFELYSSGKGNQIDEVNMKKVKEHYADVLLAGVVTPKMSRKDDGSGFYIQDLFNDWDLVERLYQEVMKYTYGKKKLKKV
jgi:hypothetical protein